MLHLVQFDADQTCQVQDKVCGKCRKKSPKWSISFQKSFFFHKQYFINAIRQSKKKDYYKAFSQEEICTKEYKQDNNDDNDEGVAMWLV